MTECETRQQQTLSPRSFLDYTLPYLLFSQFPPEWKGNQHSFFTSDITFTSAKNPLSKGPFLTLCYKASNIKIHPLPSAASVKSSNT